MDDQTNWLCGNVMMHLQRTDPTMAGTSERDARTLRQFQTYLGKVSEKDRNMLMAIAAQLARR